MARREQLHELLVEVLGSRNVYFQPGPSIKLSYPCIVYSRDQIRTTHADNNPYRSTRRYQLTIMDQDPDSEIVDRVEKLAMTSFSRNFKADNLNHDVFTIYY